MKKTEVFEGYVGKIHDVTKEDIAAYRSNDRLYLSLDLFDTKEDEEEWSLGDWPPKKARLTIILETGKDLK